MKKISVLIGAAMLLALPMVAGAAGLQGDCYDCHTMHNSEQNTKVVATAQPNLLKFDCLGCHAQSPSAGSKNWAHPGGSVIPQVAHANPALADSLAGGNFNQGSSRKAHSVADLVVAGIIPAVPMGENLNNQLPGTPHPGTLAPFTSGETANAFDRFTCAGSRGCHGTRAQLLTTSNNSTNTWANRRVGIAAISGAHHLNSDGQKITSGYGGVAATHASQTVADGYRFIVGLQGWESANRENADSANHNEYYGAATGFGTGCGACHVQGTGAGSITTPTTDSGIKVANGSMSGFCSSCHGMFHSAGGGDFGSNGVSGAFLRHPSDFVIPNEREYQFYTTYNVTAPVARNSVATGASSTVTPGQDMVMCLSCHVAHGSPNDYLLRFDYTAMTAGVYTPAEAQAAGGCLACHTQKGLIK